MPSSPNSPSPAPSPVRAGSRSDASARPLRNAAPCGAPVPSACESLGTMARATKRPPSLARVEPSGLTCFGFYEGDAAPPLGRPDPESKPSLRPPRPTCRSEWTPRLPTSARNVDDEKAVTCKTVSTSDKAKPRGEDSTCFGHAELRRRISANPVYGGRFQEGSMHDAA